MLEKRYSVTEDQLRYRFNKIFFEKIAKALQTVDMDNPDEDSLSFYPDGTPRFVGMD